MSQCPICGRKLELQGRRSYKEHVQREHHLFWLQSRRLRWLATLTLAISLVLTFLLAVIFNNPDVAGFGVMGLAALFLAFSSAFALKDRALPKKFREESTRTTMSRPKKRAKQNSS